MQLLSGLLVLVQHLGPLIQGIYDHFHLVHCILFPLLQSSSYFFLLLLQVPHQVPEALLQDGLLIGGKALGPEWRGMKKSCIKGKTLAFQQT